MTGCLQRERAQLALEVGADGSHVIQQAAFHQLLEEERRRARGEQVAAVGGAVIAGRNRLRHALGHERRADRHTRAERLADRHEVGLPAERLEVETDSRCVQGRSALRRQSAACRCCGRRR